MSSRNEVLDIYKKYISQGWYDNTISFADIECWVDNFEKDREHMECDPLVCADLLLNALIFYQSKHIPAIIRSIENRIKSRLNQEKQKLGYRLSENELAQAWCQYKQECFICSAARPEDAGTSAHQAARDWRNITDIETGTVVQLKRAMLEKGKKHIFFVDDFIGTGSKMLTLFSCDLFPDANTYGFQKIKDLFEEFKNDVDFNIAVYAICKQGRRNIKEEYDHLFFYFGDLYDEQYDLQSNNCVFYDMFDAERNTITEYITNKQRELNGDHQYALNLPIAFTHGCPNNTLALYYKSNENWVGLLKETHPSNS